MPYGVFMLKRKRYKRFVLLLLAAVISVLVIILGFSAFAVARIDFSADERLFELNRSGNITKLYADSDFGDGVYTPVEYFTLNPSSDRKEWYSYGDIGDNLKNAFISIEDRAFFEHRGVDIKRTVYAAFNYFTRSRPQFGASTITQQVIKNISGDDERTPMRKVAEVLRAVHLERIYEKEEIFEVYLNLVPMGDGISGVGLASVYYFGKKPSELTLAEAAAIAGITNAPSKYNPRISHQKCMQRRNTVLRAMLDNRAISAEEYEAALAEPLNVVITDTRCENIYSWFCETVIDDVSRDLSRKLGISESAARILLTNGALSVYTTVNPEIQSILEEYFYNTENLPSKVAEGLNYSMVVTDSESGALLGIIGAAGEKTANRVLNFATAPHTPGSSIKPLSLYAPLLDSGRISWSTVFDDAPLSFREGTDGSYSPYPRNSPEVYSGLITVSDALRLSKNTVALRLYEMSNKNSIFKLLKNKFGFDTLVEEKKTESGTLTDISAAPLAFGQLTYGVSLRKLTEAYTVFPREGELEYGRSYFSVYTADGELLLDNSERSTERIFKPETARIMNKLLSLVTESGTASAVTLDGIVDTAGKTGTSGNDRDRLFIGYTPYFTAGIWCGYSEAKREIGGISKSHVEIWNELMTRIHETCLSGELLRGFSEEGLLYLPYCKDSGELPDEVCSLDVRGERTEYGYFTESSMPRVPCTRHVECMYDSLTGGIATGDCHPEDLVRIALLDIPWRSFAHEVIITDAEYVWRYVAPDVPLGDSYDAPFFVNMLADGEFVGRGKREKQFNSSCYIHDG